MWAQAASAAIGVSIVVLVETLPFSEPVRINALIVGPVVASLALIAMSEVTRALRWVNLPLGLWLAVSPLVFGFGNDPILLVSLAGVVLMPLALARGRITSRVGGGWKAVWQPGAHTPRPASRPTPRA